MSFGNLKGRYLKRTFLLTTKKNIETEFFFAFLRVLDQPEIKQAVRNLRAHVLPRIQQLQESAFSFDWLNE